MPPSSGRSSAPTPPPPARPLPSDASANPAARRALRRPEEGGMSRLFRFVAGWKGYAGLAVLCLCLGAAASWRAMSWREQASATQAEPHVAQIVERRAHITFDVEVKVENAPPQGRRETTRP